MASIWSTPCPNPYQADVSESPRRRKLAISALLLHSKHQKSYQGTLGTQELSRKGPRPAMVLYWAIQGPLKGPCDFLDSARPFLPFLKNTFSKHSEHHLKHLKLTLRG